MEENFVIVKYCSDNPEVISKIFRDHKIRFTQPCEMNDPLEFNPTLHFADQKLAYQNYELDGILCPSMELFYRIQIIESQINAYGILSLSTQPLSFDMWSRYANGHKGFLMGFKPGFESHQCMRSRNGKQNVFRKVDYVDNYVLKIEELMGDSGIIPLETLQEEFFFKKTSRWKDEHEYRLIRPLTDHLEYVAKSNYSYRDIERYLFDFSLDCVDSVVFGACMSVENKRDIINYCKGHEIRFWQAVIVRDKTDDSGKPSAMTWFQIEDYLGSVDQIYKLKPQLLLTDIAQLENKNIEKTMRIDRRSDLPYYHDYKEIVDKFIQNAKSVK